MEGERRTSSGAAALNRMNVPCNPRSHQFGAALVEEFARHSRRKPFREIPLFRALHSSIVAAAPRFSVEELHGNRSQVLFPAFPPWTTPRGQCELSDLCVVWFRRKPQPEAKITFLQAKLSKSQHSLCGISNGAISEAFTGDSTQWHLLHRRPWIVARYSTFNPPPNLLRDALLPSIGSFCIFHASAPRNYSFFYAAADAVTCPQPTTAGRVTLIATATAPASVTHGYTEQKWACCPYTFGVALFEGMIGTPVDYSGVVSPSDDAHRRGVRAWLASCLATAARRQQAIGPVVTAFLQTFDLVARDNEPSDMPGRAVIFIRGDDDETSER